MHTYLAFSKPAHFSVIIVDILHMSVCLQCFDTVGLAPGTEYYLACKNWVMGCWCEVLLSEVRCRLIAYSPADATADCSYCNTHTHNCLTGPLSGTPRVMGRYQKKHLPTHHTHSDHSATVSCLIVGAAYCQFMDMLFPGKWCFIIDDRLTDLVVTVC